MDGTTRTISVDAAPAARRASDQQGPVAAARDRPAPSTGATPGQIEAKRAAIHSATHAAHAADAAAAAEKPETPQLREDVDSVWIALRDGRRVLVGPPASISLNLRIAELLGYEQQANGAMANQFRALMSIRRIVPEGRDIEGPPQPDERVPPIGNRVDAQVVANLVGDDGIDLCIVAVNQFWPPVMTAELQVIKKNLR